jgi:MerR family transcriptional regulator, mercuric resistance operon regulatory protein
MPQGVNQGLKIGDLADRSGFSRDTLRFYERVGLLPPPRRTPAGHRVYDDEAWARLRFIRRSQELGLTLDDVRGLLKVQELTGSEVCQGVADRLRIRLRAIQQQLSTLEGFRQRLAENINLCEHSTSSVCPVIERLLEGGPEATKGNPSLDEPTNR